VRHHRDELGLGLIELLTSRFVAAATLSSSSSVNRRWRSVSRAFSTARARCAAISRAATWAAGGKVACALNDQDAERIGSRIER